MSIETRCSGSVRMGVSKVAWYADRVLVPAEALRLSDSAPPKRLRKRTLPYAEPSTLPRSVPVLREIRDLSRALR